VLERLGLDRLEERLVEPDRAALERFALEAALERFALELDRAERPPPLLPPRRCASAIVGRVVPSA
jgi:hypothetical protein